ncbi:hypothetical protein B0H16DRAFT_557857 [Mycena metata]|uniref:Uncharacterized protein n=1 Tax=Mycena metata TaxID=1033252 RepID=A0AAD7JAZ6_9AGAR|nr:hypothetical protein B0H16DRAFT_557857 [Mycena metata]
MQTLEHLDKPLDVVCWKLVQSRDGPGLCNPKAIEPIVALLVSFVNSQNSSGSLTFTFSSVHLSTQKGPRTVNSRSATFGASWTIGSLRGGEMRVKIGRGKLFFRSSPFLALDSPLVLVFVLLVKGKKANLRPHSFVDRIIAADNRMHARPALAIAADNRLVYCCKYAPLCVGGPSGHGHSERSSSSAYPASPSSSVHSSSSSAGLSRSWASGSGSTSALNAAPAHHNSNLYSNVSSPPSADKTQNECKADASVHSQSRALTVQRPI